MKIRCPHCKGWSKVVRSEQLTPTTRASDWRCKDPDCGCTFKTHTEVSVILSLSSKPDAALRVQLSKHIDVDQLKLQLEI